MTRALLLECVRLFDLEVEAIERPHAWPPRGPMSAEERREADRLRVTGSRLFRRAMAMPEVQS